LVLIGKKPIKKTIITEISKRRTLWIRI